MRVLKKIAVFSAIVIFSVSFIMSIFYANQLFKDKNYYISIKANEIENIISNNDYMYIYFYKLDCHPCSLFKVTLNNVLSEISLDVYAVDLKDKTVETEELINKYKLKYTPSLIKYKDKKEIKRIEGNIEKSEVINFLK